MASDKLPNKHEIFRTHPLFGQLTPGEIDRLMTYTRIQRYRAKATIFLKGAPGSGMMAVLDGRVKISTTSADGREVVLNVIGPGQVFGEIALLDGKDRTADATAMTACEVLVLERRDFIPFLERHLDVCMRLMGVLCERLRRTSQQVEDLLFLDLPAHLAKILLRLAGTVGHPVAGGIRIDLKLSQRELGNMVGMTRESINKQLRIWQKRGLLALDRGSLVIKNADAFRRISDNQSTGEDG